MTAEWSLPAWAVLATLGLLLVGLVALLGLVAVVARARRAALAESAHLQAQVDAIEERLAAAAEPEHRAAARPERASVEEREYVITRLGSDEDPEPRDPAPTVEAPLFADLVLREGVVQAASIAAGVRRALAPSHLNRVRFEMRREVKRARKQRRADLRQARREHDARQRADLRESAA